MEKIVFALEGNEELAQRISSGLNVEKGEMVLHEFPDGETYVRLLTKVTGKVVIIVASLNRPDTRIIPLYFLSKTLREMEAAKIILVAPYLAYMRQDKRFKPGEAVTSRYFAEFVASFTDELITIDPHLHRTGSLSELYSIPCTVIPSAASIAGFIKANIDNPLLIGPDSESEQWVSEIAAVINSPFIVLQKERYSDTEVKIQVPKVERYLNCTPVLIDDIISSAHTMIEAVKQLNQLGMKAPVCIGVHAVFARGAYETLVDAGVKKVLTCNTIPHESNSIDISGLLIETLKGN
jgi:ribose-phosphate pyrophosphokinase